MHNKVRTIKTTQEHMESADLRHGKSDLDLESRFLVRSYIYDKIFMNIPSIFPEI